MLTLLNGKKIPLAIVAKTNIVHIDLERSVSPKTLVKAIMNCGNTLKTPVPAHH